MPYQEESYINEKGLVVFTEAYHLRRGYCCGNGCLHCPFLYKNVPEPRRSKLIQKQQDEAKEKSGKRPGKDTLGSQL